MSSNTINLQERVSFWQREFYSSQFEVITLINDDDFIETKLVSLLTKKSMVVIFNPNTINYRFNNFADEEAFLQIMTPYLHNYHHLEIFSDHSLVLQYSIISKFLNNISFPEVELLYQLGAEALDLGYDNVKTNDVSQYSKFKYEQVQYEIREYYTTNMLIIKRNQQIIYQKRLPKNLTEESTITFKYNLVQRLHQQYQNLNQLLH